MPTEDERLKMSLDELEQSKELLDLNAKFDELADKLKGLENPPSCTTGLLE